MRIAICDEDEQELARLSGEIAKYQSSRGVSIDCHSYCNITDFLCELEGGEYDLVLIDALMSEGGGAQAARELRELDKNVEIIFISASSEFAVESYSVRAYYYLLKPVDENSLFPLLDSVESKLFVQGEQGFVLKSRKGVVRVAFSRLEYVEVIDKTVSFHLEDGVVHEITAALADFEKKLLDRPEFIKTHRAYLVNLSYVQAIDVNCIATKNGHDIPVSRQRRSQVQEAYMHFLHQTGTKMLRSGKEPAVSGERLDSAWRILLVDDDLDERAYWAEILRAHGCIVDMAGNGGEALKMASDGPCDCILLDVMIPGKDGFSICKRLRGLMDVPVIFLSCLTESDSQLEGFAAGGIDYITKDTPPELFWAKVETRIRVSRARQSRTQFRYGPLLLDLAERRGLMDGKELSLTSAEFDILWCLSEHAGQIFSPEEVFEMVFGSQPGDDRQVAQIHMSRLRRKLDKAWEAHHFIETVWGQGYRFVSPD